ncbi:uncharacterized protein LOC106425115 isoform X2 [Brassica napus]|uniref:uncharacterized protein LOC106425115 isoform X2 n=1 Tax=Brassica napus TaxID=3708 RepID=UPI0006AB4798|nr:uncharacterized protein LOC106425115 isoform X2 [Brassica napus]
MVVEEAEAVAAVAETVVEVEVVMEEAAEAVAAAVEALVEVAVFSDSIAKFCLSNSVDTKMVDMVVVEMVTREEKMVVDTVEVEDRRERVIYGGGSGGGYRSEGCSGYGYSGGDSEGDGY